MKEVRDSISQILDGTTLAEALDMSEQATIKKLNTIMYHI
jgi:hypothetical protein